MKNTPNEFIYRNIPQIDHLTLQMIDHLTLQMAENINQHALMEHFDKILKTKFMSSKNELLIKINSDFYFSIKKNLLKEDLCEFYITIYAGGYIIYNDNKLTPMYRAIEIHDVFKHYSDDLLLEQLDNALESKFQHILEQEKVYLEDVKNNLQELIINQKIRG